MMKRILNILFALAAIVGSASAQILSVQDIEVQPGGQTELVVSLAGGTGMTALQFNMKMPDGVTIDVANATLGSATDGHTLAIETLSSGDLLFVLYSMDLNTFMDGEVLRIPVTAGSGEITSSGSLYTIRTATAEAVSHTALDATFNVKVADDLSGIKETERVQTPQRTFDLQGRPLSRSSRGIVIVGNRKVIIK